MPCPALFYLFCNFSYDTYIILPRYVPASYSFFLSWVTPPASGQIINFLPAEPREGGNRTRDCRTAAQRTNHLTTLHQKQKHILEVCSSVFEFKAQNHPRLTATVGLKENKDVWRIVSYYVLFLLLYVSRLLWRQ